MPSTTSSVVSSVLASSTVIVPSLPTLSIASEMMAPISVSPFAEIVATCLISSADFTFLDILAIDSTTAPVAASMPFLRDIAFAPAVRFLRPSR